MAMATSSPRKSLLNVSRNRNSMRNSLYQSDYDTAIEDTDESGSIYFSMDESVEKNDMPETVENKENVSESESIPPFPFNPVSNSSILLKKTLKKQLAANTEMPLRNKNLRVSFYSPIQENIPEPPTNEASPNDDTLVAPETRPEIVNQESDEHNVNTNESDNRSVQENVTANDSDRNHNVDKKDAVKPEDNNSNKNGLQMKGNNKRLTINYIKRNIRNSTKPVGEPKIVKNKPKLVIVPVNSVVKPNNPQINVPNHNNVKAQRIQARKSILDAKKLFMPSKKATQPGKKHILTFK